jgi:hypothetical protein
VLFIDAIGVKIRDGQVSNRPIYVAIGVTVAGHRDILGLWAGDGGEGAKFWLGVLTDIKNRGVQDVCIVVCDGLKGLPESITTTWSLAQSAGVHPPPREEHLPVCLPQGLGGHSAATCHRSTPRRTSPQPPPGSTSSPAICSPRTPGVGRR